MILLCALFFTFASAIIVDGKLDREYGISLATQTVNTQYGDNLNELDAAYASIDGGNLALFLSGNLEANGNRLVIYFEGDNGQNVVSLGASSPIVANASAVNSAFGGPLNGDTGLKFDVGFLARYALVFNVRAANQKSAVFYDATNGGYAFATNPASLLSIGSAGINIAFDNSNTDGVVGTGSAAANATAANEVTTGFEVSIPLAQLGRTGANATEGTIRFVAFIENTDGTKLSNQALGGFPVGTMNFDNAKIVDFSTLAGNQFVVVQYQLATCNLVQGTSTTASGSFSVQQTGPTFTVQGAVSGISAGDHGIHIHVYGNTASNCTAAGLHYNPYNVTHGGPLAAVRHVGDLGNINANASGVAIVSIVDAVANLTAVAGRAIVVHANPDDYGLGNFSDSLTVGHAGPRLACCIITTSNSVPITAPPTTSTTPVSTIAGGNNETTVTTAAANNATTVTTAATSVAGNTTATGSTTAGVTSGNGTTVATTSSTAAGGSTATSATSSTAAGGTTVSPVTSTTNANDTASTVGTTTSSASVRVASLLIVALAFVLGF